MKLFSINSKLAEATVYWVNADKYVPPMPSLRTFCICRTTSLLLSHNRGYLSCFYKFHAPAPTTLNLSIKCRTSVSQCSTFASFIKQDRHTLMLCPNEPKILKGDYRLWSCFEIMKRYSFCLWQKGFVCTACVSALYRVCVGLTWSSIPMRLCLWSSEREGCDESALIGYPGYPLGNVCTGNPGATQGGVCLARL